MYNLEYTRSFGYWNPEESLIVTAQISQIPGNLYSSLYYPMASHDQRRTEILVMPKKMYLNSDEGKECN